MQGFTGWLKGAVPDNEPSLVADWKSYANNQPNATAARSDGVLSSAEEGTSSTLGGFWNSTFSSFTSAANGAAGSMSSGMASIPGTTQWTYFAALAGTGAVFLLLAFFVFLPVIILVPSKFAITFSMGSALVLSSLGALRGWKALAISMISKERTPFTTAYVVSLAATLYSSLVMHSYIFSLVCCAGQIVTLVYFIASFFPGGAAGAQYVLGTLGQGSLAMGGAIFRSIFSR